MLDLSASVSVRPGATCSFVTSIARSTESAYIRSNSAVVERSFGLSAVQRRAATWPGGVMAARLKSVPGKTGPFSVQRRVRVTGL